MPKFVDEESRLAYYTNKYGEEEGLARYEKAAGGSPSPDAPMRDAQPSLLTGEKQPRRSSRTKKPSKRDVVTSVGTAIAMTDMGVAMFWPPWQEDRLSHEEIGRLADALADEILNSDKLCQMLVKAQQSGVHIKLAWVCMSIAIPRLARHGVLPAELFGAPQATGTDYQVDENGVVATPADYAEAALHASVGENG